MNVEPKPPTSTGTVDRFTGQVRVDPIASPKDGDQRLIVSRVRFAPGSRTAWHAHGRGQTLHVTQGVALLGTRDGTVIRATPGQTIYTPPGEEHWHGAGPDDFMEHLAILEPPTARPPRTAGSSTSPTRTTGQQQTQKARAEQCTREPSDKV